MRNLLRAAAQSLAILAGALLLTTPALAAPGSDGFLDISGGKNAVRAAAPVSATPQLVAGTTAIAPGTQAPIAFVLQHETGWHSYGPFSGDTGYATKVHWTLPAGWEVKPSGWPLPETLKTGSLVDYVYSGRLVLPYTLSAPASAAPGSTAAVHVEASWLACKDVCVPGSGSADLTVTVGSNGQATPEAAEIEHASHLLPQAAPEAAIAVVGEDKRARLDLSAALGPVQKTLTFYPEGKKQIDVHAAQVFSAADGKRSLFLTLSPLAAPLGSWPLTGVLAADDGPQAGGWAVRFSTPITIGTVGATPVALPTGDAEGPSITGLAAIALAFLGGLILNLMPCVFPVLSLKILQLVDGRNRQGPLAVHGIVFTLGVLVSMLALAGALLALRTLGYAVGWGFQLQSPWVVAILALLFFALALNVGGLFEITAGTSIADTKTVRSLSSDGPAGSFWTGVLAVIVASPCTAPFMGAAMGYAITQPVVESLLVFAALGLGMAFPWFVLTIAPFWVKWLPRPGAWMLWFKRIMALPLVGAFVWLAWVLSQQVQWWGIIILLIACAAIAVFYWTIGRAQHGRQALLPLRIGSFAVALACVAIISQGQTAVTTHDVEAGWEPWSLAAQQSALSQGKPVFVDFTAAWCVTCQYNKKAVLTTPQAQKLFAAAGVTLFAADWTNQDAAISQELDKFNRTGVPLYLLYDGRGQVQVLPQLLTMQDLEAALDKLPQK